MHMYMFARGACVLQHLKLLEVFPDKDSGISSRPLPVHLCMRRLAGVPASCWADDLAREVRYAVGVRCL
jgi:hypothetical protein